MSNPHGIRPSAWGPTALALPFVLALAAGCAPSPADIQRGYARALKPASVTPTDGDAPARDAATLRVLKVRAYADEDYRTQTLRWTHRISAQVARASAITEAQFGVRLEVESVLPWDRHDGSRDLHEALRELAQLDPARDVDWVVGFVSSTAVLVGLTDQEGIAQLFGRHFVLRGMDSAEEAGQVDLAFDKLGAEERLALVRERRLHRETAVMLHEWAHTLGAIHECASRWIMSGRYDISQAQLSPESARLVAVGLRHRDASAAEGLRLWAEAYREEVRSQEGAASGCRAREEGLAEADRYLSSAGSRRASGTSGAAPPALAQPDAIRLDEAFKLAGRGDLDAAANAHATLAQRYPRHAGVGHLGCWIALRRAPRSPEALAACQDAARLEGAPAEAFLLLAHALADRGDRAGAVATLGRAEKALDEPTHPAASWRYLAQLYAVVDACSAAERAAGRAPGDEGAAQVVGDCAHVRREFALPRGTSAVPVEREPEYVAALRAAQRDLAARRFASARKHAEALRAAYPAAPGADLVTCLVGYAQERGAARKGVNAACAAAAAAAPDAFQAEYVLGLLACEEAQWKQARIHLRRAIDIDGAPGEAWKRLAAVEKQLGDGRALKALKARYLDRFGAELRPSF